LRAREAASSRGAFFQKKARARAAFAWPLEHEIRSRQTLEGALWWQLRPCAGLGGLRLISARATLLILPQDELARPTARDRAQALNSSAPAFESNARLVRLPIGSHGPTRRTSARIGHPEVAADRKSAFFARCILGRLARRHGAAAQADPRNDKEQTQPTWLRYQWILPSRRAHFRVHTPFD
jgi:hypothetical protein